METSEQLFRSIYERYLPALRICASNYGVAKDDIDDVVQETFIAYYRKYPLTWNDSQIKSMLGTICRNLSIDYMRKNTRRPLVLYDPQEMGQTDGVLERLVAPDSLTMLVEEERQQVVWDGIKAMREDWAQVIILHFVYDYPIQDVSRILNTTDAACRTRITRARKALIQYIKKHSH